MSDKKYLATLTLRSSRIEKLLRDKMPVTSMIEGSSYINSNKDFVAYGHIVPSLCEPNKILATNEHKQLVQTHITQWLYGTPNQIDVVNNNGHAILKCPQDLGINSSPLFKSVKVKNEPTDQRDVASKLYVDTEIQKMKLPELNACSKISIINPEGDCLRIGRNGGNFVNINVDKDGSLNLTNEKPNGQVNEIDIYGEKINFLSNVNAVRPNHGSVVMYGGLGVMQDLQLGGKLYLNTYKGIPTGLDYFEEGSMSIVWEGIWNDSVDTLLVYQRIGKWVMLTIPYTSSRATTEGIIENTLETYLPERLRPIYDIKTTIGGYDDDKEIDVKVTIFGDDGKISIYPKGGQKFTGVGISGFDTFSVSYMMDDKELLKS